MQGGAWQDWRASLGRKEQRQEPDWLLWPGWKKQNQRVGTRLMSPRYVVDHIRWFMLSICLCGDGVGQELADIRVALEFDLEEVLWRFGTIQMHLRR